MLSSHAVIAVLSTIREPMISPVHGDELSGAVQFRRLSNSRNSRFLVRHPWDRYAFPAFVALIWFVI
jgi:hypothetical protein